MKYWMLVVTAVLLAASFGTTRPIEAAPLMVDPTFEVSVTVPSSVSAGQTVEATVTVKNTTSVQVTDVIIGGAVPARTTHVSGGTEDTSLYSGYTYARFNYSKIGVGETVTFKHSFKIPDNAQGGSSYRYDDVYIKASSDTSILTQYLRVNKTMTVPAAAQPQTFDNTTVKIAATTQTPITQGGNYTITIEVRNTGTGTTPSLNVAAPVPSGTTFVSGGTYNSNYNFNKDEGPHAVFPSFTLEAGKTQTLHYIVTVPDNPSVGTAYAVQTVFFTYQEGNFIKGSSRNVSASMLVEQPATTVASYKIDGTAFSTPVDGFGFNNYGNSGRTWQDDLSAADLFTMFGPRVCQSGNTADTCKLTTTAEKWQLNSASGGHCEGMAVTSLRLFEQRAFKNKTTPSDFGASQTAGLSLTADIENYVMYYFALQSTDTVYDSYANNRLKPSEIVNNLIQIFNGDNPVGQTIGIYKPGYKEGHAIVATAVEKVDDNNYRIIVYDNNYPKQRKYIEVNTANETWRYSTAANPSQDASAYEGNAQTKTLEYAPVTSREKAEGQYFKCPFCNSDSSDASAAQEGSTITIAYHGEGDVLIVDDQGRKVGYDFFDTNTYVEEITGTTILPIRIGPGLEVPPSYTVPASDGIYEVYVGARSIVSPTNGSLSIQGPGFFMGLDYIELPADGSTYRFRVSSDGELLAIDTDTDEDVLLPAMYIAYDPVAEGESSVSIDLDGLQLAPFEDAIIELDKTNERFYFETSDPYENYFDLILTKINSDGNTYEQQTTVLTPENLDFAYVDYGSWNGTDKLSVVIEQKSTVYLPMIQR